MLSHQWYGNYLDPEAWLIERGEGECVGPLVAILVLILCCAKCYAHESYKLRVNDWTDECFLWNDYGQYMNSGFLFVPRADDAPWWEGSLGDLLMPGTPGRPETGLLAV
jgi:hypothetical protein